MLQHPFIIHSEAASSTNFPQLFHSSLITCTFISQHISPRIPLAIILSSPPGFIYFVSILISTLNREFSKLLLLSGDVECNPEPLPVNENPVCCTINSSKVNRGIQQSMVPTCSETKYYARRPQACNGLTCNQSRHEKSCGLTITPKCSKHGTGIAEIAIPSPTSFCLGKLCSVYNNPI